jgi:hypothetical protein
VTLTADVLQAVCRAAALDNVHRVFLKWLGDEYDLAAIDVTLATAAALRLKGDPLWALLVSGPGNAKTETVSALAGAGAIVTSTIASEGALLSGTSRKEKSKDATGGLLRRIGDSGVLVPKDVTSILSMDRNTRGGVMAALREIYDGKWERNLGTDGGRSLAWTGRIAVIGAVTTSWDRCYDVVSAMGDRFVLLRMNSSIGRLSAGRHAIGNTGSEDEMRAELSDVVREALRHVEPDDAIGLTDSEQERLLAAADLVTLCRTAVDVDYRGDVIDAHAPEMPTRFAKQLAQVVRGAAAVGMDRSKALELAIRCARDSMPPLRLAILDDIAEWPNSRTADVRRRLDKPWSTIDRQLQSLHMLGVLVMEEDEVTERNRPVWRYRVAENINPAAIRLSPDLLPPGHKDTEGKNSHVSTHIFGEREAAGTPGFRFDGDPFRSKVAL